MQTPGVIKSSRIKKIPRNFLQILVLSLVYMNENPPISPLLNLVDSLLSFIASCRGIY